VIVSTTGMLSRELFEHRVARGESGERDFLTVGSMGHASAIALGMAMREPQREVWCFDGDGALLMHLGNLAVIADHPPERSFHVVFNNAVHDSAGGQPTSTGELAEEVVTMRSYGGPALLELTVRPGSRPDLGRPTRTPADSKRTFMAALRQDES
jgi:phosphonopyruvate decarboxylase